MGVFSVNANQEQNYMPIGDSDNSFNMGHYRKDGVKINHDPYALGMAEKYGLPGSTDPEGFDPYADTVGPGIYGGSVDRDKQGNIAIGEQYQNHNNRPGPIYNGRGYSLINAQADIYVQDTYGYTALHRMASNNLDVGGEALVLAGHDPNLKMNGADSTPIEIARRSRAIQFLMKMQKLGHYD